MSEELLPDLDTSPWSPELQEWVYGPPGEEDDEPISTGEEYHIAEEEERIRWLPGYRQTVLALIASSLAWHARWVPGEPYPPEPEEHRRLAERVSELSKVRARPPWEEPSK